jgi:uncharacterized protein HemY
MGYMTLQMHYQEKYEQGREDGQAMQIIKMSLKYNVDKDKIITELVEELNISTKQAEQYLVQYGKK